MNQDANNTVEKKKPRRRRGLFRYFSRVIVLKPRLTFDQLMYLVVAAPAIFFGWFVISGVFFVWGALWSIRKLYFLDSIAEFQNVENDVNIAFFVGLIAAFVSSIFMSRKTILASWPERTKNERQKIALPPEANLSIHNDSCRAKEIADETIKGILHFFSETGTRGGYWAVQNQRYISKNTTRFYCKICFLEWDKSERATLDPNSYRCVPGNSGNAFSKLPPIC